jgi:hypothetical protein
VRSGGYSRIWVPVSRDLKWTSSTGVENVSGTFLFAYFIKGMVLLLAYFTCLETRGSGKN